MKLKVMSNVKFATDIDSGDIYVIDGNGSAYKIADASQCAIDDSYNEDVGADEDTNNSEE